MEDFLKFPRKINTLLGMPLYTFSTNKFGEDFGALLTAFHQYFTEIIVIIVTVGQFWAVPHIYEDMNVLCGCLSSGAHSAQVIAKTTLLRQCKTQYLAHIKAIHDRQKETDSFEYFFLQKRSEFSSYHQRKTKYVRVIVVIQLLVNFASTSAYFLPFVYNSIVYKSEVKDQLTPIVVYIPMDFNYTPLFQVIVLTLTVGFFVINLKTVVIDNFLLNLIVLHMSQLKYHNNLLKKVMERQNSNDVVNKDVIRVWIKQQQALSSICNKFRNLISPYLFIEFSYILIHTCVPAFVITSTFSWTLPQKVAVFCMVGGGLIELFLMSSAGGVLSDTVMAHKFMFNTSSQQKEIQMFLRKTESHVWLSTGNELFQSEYFLENEKWMKHVILLIRQKAQRPFSLSAFNIIPLNRGTFASLLRLIFSYYMTLNQMQKIKPVG